MTRSDRSGGPLFGFAGGRDVFCGARERFRLMTNPCSCVPDTLPYTIPVVSNPLLGRCRRDETFIAAWIGVDIHDTSRSAEHGAHSIGHRDPLGDGCMRSGAVRPFCSHPGLLTERGICHVAGKIAQVDGLHGPRAKPGATAGAVAWRFRYAKSLIPPATTGAVAWRFRYAKSRPPPATADAIAPDQRGGRTGPPPRTSMVQDTASGALRPTCHATA